MKHTKGTLKYVSWIMLACIKKKKSFCQWEIMYKTVFCFKKTFLKLLPSTFVSYLALACTYERNNR